MPRSLSAWLASEHGLLRCARKDRFALMQSYPKPTPLLLGKLRLVKVENFPCMAIQVKKPALVHKAVVFSGAVFHRASRQSLVDERIDFGAGDNARTATVSEVSYLGEQSVYRLLLADGIEIRASRLNRDGPAARVGERVTVSWPAAAALVFPAEAA